MFPIDEKRIIYTRTTTSTDLERRETLSMKSKLSKKSQKCILSTIDNCPSESTSSEHSQECILSTIDNCPSESTSSEHSQKYISSTIDDCPSEHTSSEQSQKCILKDRTRRLHASSTSHRKPQLCTCRDEADEVFSQGENTS